MTLPLLAALALGVPAVEGQSGAEAPGAALALAQLEARRAVAEAAADAAATYFAGETTLDWRAAFPALAGADLHDPEVVQVERWRLLQEGHACTPQGRQPPPVAPPGEWSAAQQRDWDQAQEATCTAESQRRAQQGRFLTGLAEGLRTAPAFTRERLEEALQAYTRTRRQALQGAATEPTVPGVAPPPVAEGDLDPRRRSALERAAAATDAAATLRRYADAALRAMTIVGDAALADLVALDASALAALPTSEGKGDDTASAITHRAVRYRLRAALPLLSKDSATQVRQALEVDLAREVEAALPRLRREIQGAERALATATAPGNPPDGDPEASRLPDDAARTRLRALEEQLPALTREAKNPPTATDLELSARLAEQAQLTLDLARLRAAALRRQLGLETGEDDLSRQEAESATRAQAASAQEAAAASERGLEGLPEGDRFFQETLVQLQRDTAEILETEADRHSERNATLDALDATAAAVEAQERSARAQPSLSLERQQMLDQTFRDLRDLLGALHREIGAQLETNQTFRHDGAQQEAPELTIPANLAAWEEAHKKYNAALARRANNSYLELETLARLHRSAQRRYWNLRPEISPAVQRTSLPGLEREALWEVSTAIPLLDLQRRRAVERFEQWGSRLRQRRSWIMTLVEAAQFLLVLALLVLFVRILRQLRPWIHWWLDLSPSSSAQRPDLRNAAVTAARAVVLFGVIWVLARPWWDFPLFLALGLPLLAILLYRSISMATRLAIEALHRRWETRVYGRALTARIVRTVRLLTAWWLLCWVVERLLEALLHAEALLELAHGFFRLGLLGLTLYLLFHWTPVLRKIVAQDAHRNFVAGWLARPPARGDTFRERLWHRLGMPLHELPRGLGSLGYLALHGLSHRLGSERGQAQEVAHLQAALARAQLGAEGTELRRLDGSEGDPDGARIAARTQDRQWPRGPEQEELQRAVKACLTTDRRGLIAVIGDRGAGKSSLVHQAGAIGMESAKKLEPGEIQVVELHLRGRIVDPGRALGWLARELGLPAPQDATVETLRETLPGALAKRPPTLFLVDDLHRLMVRSVAGLDAVRTVLEIFQAAAERHCFVIGFHAPSWAYLEATAVGLDLEMFRSRIHLPRVSGEWLQAWFDAGLKEAGFVADYRRLQRHRTESTEALRTQYFQLLAEESQGNPGVALRFWLESLRKPVGDGTGSDGSEGDGSESDKPKIAMVTLFTAPTLRDLAECNDLSLFVLKALWVHGELSLRHLARTLNQPQSMLREVCSNLQDLGTLFEEGEVYAVDTRWQPAVHRLLRQKHFLHHSEKP